MDDGGSPIWALTVFILFIMINGILYGFGAAVQKISENELEKRTKEEGDKKAQWILKIMENPSPIIHTILTIATLLSIMTGYTAIHSITPYVFRWLTELEAFWGAGVPNWILKDTALILVVIFSLIVLLSFGVISAKKVFNSNPDAWVYRTAGIVKFLVTLFKPVTFLIMKLSNVIVRLFGVDPHKQEDDVTEEEIISIDRKSVV